LRFISKYLPRAFISFKLSLLLLLCCHQVLAWESRRPKVAAELKAAAADIICLQEVNQPHCCVRERASLCVLFTSSYTSWFAPVETKVHKKCQTFSIFLTFPVIWTANPMENFECIFFKRSNSNHRLAKTKRAAVRRRGIPVVASLSCRCGCAKPSEANTTLRFQLRCVLDVQVALTEPYVHQSSSCKAFSPPIHEFRRFLLSLICSIVAIWATLCWEMFMHISLNAHASIMCVWLLLLPIMPNKPCSSSCSLRWHKLPIGTVGCSASWRPSATPLACGAVVWNCCQLKLPLARSCFRFLQHFLLSFIRVC